MFSEYLGWSVIIFLVISIDQLNWTDLRELVVFLMIKLTVTLFPFVMLETKSKWLCLVSHTWSFLDNNQHQSDSEFIMLFSLTRTLTVWSTTKNSATSWVRILCYSFVNLIKSIFGFRMKKRSGTKSGADIIWHVWIRKSDFLSKYWTSMDFHVYNHFQFHFIFLWLLI